MKGLAGRIIDFIDIHIRFGHQPFVAKCLATQIACMNDHGIKQKLVLFAAVMAPDQNETASGDIINLARDSCIACACQTQQTPT